VPAMRVCEARGDAAECVRADLRPFEVWSETEPQAGGLLRLLLLLRFALPAEAGGSLRLPTAPLERI
jgi:hypothetical protein